MERDIHTYRQTDRQSDLVFIFLRMRLLASPFGLTINFQEHLISGFKTLKFRVARNVCV
jgi:hypothetical protein